MLRWIGAIMVLCGFGLTGFELYRTMKKDLEMTKGFVKSFLFMQDEMKYAKSHIDRVLEKCESVSSQTEPFFKKVLERFSADGKLDVAWRETISEADYIGSELKSCVTELSNVLGTTDLETQLNLLQQATGQLECLESEQTEVLKKKGLLYPKIGFAIGILVVILLF